MLNIRRYNRKNRRNIRRRRTNSIKWARNSSTYYKMNSKGEIEITEEIAAQSFNKKKTMFDKNGDSHYDNISAMIKSLRGSDSDAAIFYLARALEAGEDPMFLARRLVISAAEDVGLANPQALVIATSAMQAVSMVGMPEARIILAEAAVYIAESKNLMHHIMR